MEITSIGNSALIAAGSAAHIHANNIANVSTPGFTQQAPVYSSVVNGGVAVFAQDVNQQGSLIQETLGLITATTQYQAAANLIRTGEELSETFLRELA